MADAGWTALDLRLAVAFALLRHRRTSSRTVGQHRSTEPRAICWWVWALVALGYAWLTWRMAVIELPAAVAAGVLVTAVVAFGAGHTAGSER